MTHRQPRPGGVKKRTYRRGDFEKHKAKWERDRKAKELGGGDWLTDNPAFEVDAVSFLAVLRKLFYVTQDRRFLELHRSLMSGTLIDNKWKWSRYDIVLANPLAQDVCEWIGAAIEAGKSGHSAIAEVTAELGIDATDFEAAYKRVERVWRAWKVRQNPR